MTNHCVMCGSSIPDGQRTCSMCYGDIDHGKDGYYRRWAEEQEREDTERRHQQEQEEAQHE